jgi:hypothetical protein
MGSPIRFNESLLSLQCFRRTQDLAEVLWSIHPNLQRHVSASYPLTLSIWQEPREGAAPTWRGYLETRDGQRHYFATFADLESLVLKASGWAEPGKQPSNTNR